jgi:hypothetical protein
MRPPPGARRSGRQAEGCGGHGQSPVGSARSWTRTGRGCWRWETPSSARNVLKEFGQLARWMAAEEIAAAELTAGRSRSSSGPARCRTWRVLGMRSFGTLLDCLSDEGTIAPPEPALSAPPDELIGRTTDGCSPTDVNDNRAGSLGPFLRATARLRPRSRPGGRLPAEAGRSLVPARVGRGGVAQIQAAAQVRCRWPLTAFPVR